MAMLLMQDVKYIYLVLLKEQIYLCTSISLHDQPFSVYLFVSQNVVTTSKNLHGFHSYFSCCFPWAICQTFFNLLKKYFKKYVWGIFYEYVLFLLTCSLYGSKNFKIYKSQLKFFNFFSEFSSQ